MNLRPSPRLRLIALVGILVIVGLIAETITTRSGSRLTPDSVVYIDTARALLGSAPGYPTGLLVPASHFPPLYSILLALAADITRTDPLSVGRWLNVIFFAVTLALVGAMSYRFTRKLAVTGFVVFFMLSQPEMLRKFGSVLSEPLFMVCLLVAIWLLIEDRIVWAGMFAALALLTRYVGLTLIGGGVCGLLLLSTQPWPMRVRKAAIFGGIGLAPLLVWLARNVLATGNSVNRTVALHLFGGAQLQSGLTAISRWFMLDATPRAEQIVAVIIIAAGIVAMGWGVYRSGEPARESPGNVPLMLLAPRWIGLISLFYAGGLILSISVIDAATPFDDRLLLPLFPLGALALVCLISAANGRYGEQLKRMRILRIVGIVIWALFVVFYGVIGLGTVGQGGATGQNYADARWSQSPLLPPLRNLPPNVLIVTDVPEVPYLYAPRPTAHLPLHYDPNSLLPNTHYAEEMATLRSELAAHTAVIAYWRETLPYYASEADLRTQLALKPIFDGPDGALYEFSTTP